MKAGLKFAARPMCRDSCELQASWRAAFTLLARRADGKHILGCESPMIDAEPCAGIAYRLWMRATGVHASAAD